MRGLETSVVRLRHEVFKEVAKVAYNSAPEDINSDIEAIPYTITPTEVPQYRESIYRERAIASERVRLAMGMSLRPSDKPVHITSGLDQSNISDKYYEPPPHAINARITSMKSPINAADASRKRAWRLVPRAPFPS